MCFHCCNIGWHQLLEILDSPFTASESFFRTKEWQIKLACFCLLTCFLGSPTCFNGFFACGLTFITQPRAPDRRYPTTALRSFRRLLLWSNNLKLEELFFPSIPFLVMFLNLGYFQLWLNTRACLVSLESCKTLLSLRLNSALPTKGVPLACMVSLLFNTCMIIFIS